MCVSRGIQDKSEPGRFYGDSMSPRIQTAAGIQGVAAKGVGPGMNEADCGLLFHCYGFKGQWSIVVSGDPIVCFRCRAQPHGRRRFPEGQAGSVRGMRNKEAGTLPRQVFHGSVNE